MSSRQISGRNARINSGKDGTALKLDKTAAHIIKYKWN
jgi:hypothetical protein